MNLSRCTNRCARIALAAAALALGSAARAGAQSAAPPDNKTTLDI
jgi:hypothetical protein